MGVEVQPAVQIGAVDRHQRLRAFAVGQGANRKAHVDPYAVATAGALVVNVPLRCGRVDGVPIPHRAKGGVHAVGIGVGQRAARDTAEERMVDRVGPEEQPSLHLHRHFVVKIPRIRKGRRGPFVVLREVCSQLWPVQRRNRHGDAVVVGAGHRLRQRQRQQHVVVVNRHVVGVDAAEILAIGVERGRIARHGVIRQQGQRQGLCRTEGISDRGGGQSPGRRCPGPLVGGRIVRGAGITETRAGKRRAVDDVVDRRQRSDVLRVLLPVLPKLAIADLVGGHDLERTRRARDIAHNARAGPGQGTVDHGQHTAHA